MNTAFTIGMFKTKGTLSSIKANHQGHINSTFVCSFLDQGTLRKYTLQKINKKVFQHPDEVMENIHLITSHIQSKISNLPDKEKRCLHVIPTRDGQLFYLDDEGEYWRAYDYIEDVRTYETISDAKQAYLLGESVGLFQTQLSDFDGQKLHVTIPDFHHMGWRYRQLDQAVQNDVMGRFSLVKEEYQFLMDNKERGERIWDGMTTGIYPVRVTHNDTKMNNVLFSMDGSQALCIIDLDTVMPGTILFDTGDMIRTATNTAKEDERDLSLVRCDATLFSSLLKGYRKEAGKFLTEAEASSIAESGRTTTQIMAVRFLTDYLAGDHYYQIERPSHNLDRSRTQIALMKSMDAQWDVLIKS